MAYFQCSTCKRTREFNGHPQVESRCGNCGTLNPWKQYNGPVSAIILQEEDAQYAILVNERRKLRQAMDTAWQAYTDLEAEFLRIATPSREEILKKVTEVELCHRCIAGLNSQDLALVARMEPFGNRAAVWRDAGVAQSTAAGQSELYVGNRQYVSTFATRGNKGKILDVPNWSWGLNCAWVEGGISAKAHFTVKIDTSNPYTQIPQVIEDALNQEPGMKYESFLDLCREHGRRSLLWYDLDGADRPTWTALEMATLLRQGYKFSFGSVVQLTPPVTASK